MKKTAADVIKVQRIRRNVAWPTPEENADLVSRIIALAGERMKLDGSDGELPNHFVLEQESAELDVGTLVDTTPGDAPTFYDDLTWQGRSPLYAVSAVCPYYHPGDILGFGKHWSLLRISLYWTTGSKKKLRRLEDTLHVQSSGQTYQVDTGSRLPTPAAIAFARMLGGGPPAVNWSGIVSSRRNESEQWCLAHPYADVVKLRGMEVRTVFKPSPLGVDSNDRKVPEIEVHKTL